MPGGRAIVGYSGFVGSNLLQSYKFDHFYNSYNTGYSQEIENLIQSTTENLTNILINGYTGPNILINGYTGPQNTSDSSNNSQTRFLFDNSNNAFILETLFFTPRRTRH